MDVETARTELGTARHDLKNLLLALRSGCMLVEARLDEGEPEGARELLGEIRAEIDRGEPIVEQLSSFERDVTAALAARSETK